VALPALGLAYLISRYAVNFWHSDQWEAILPAMAKNVNHSLQFSDLWALHYEHRPFIPRCLMVALAGLTDWNIRVESWVQFALAASVLWNINCIREKTRQSLWLMPFASLLIFSPLGWENWLLGWQIHFWMPVACWVAAVRVTLAENYNLAFFGSLVLGTIATYSIASGMFIWPVLTVLLWQRTPKDQWGDVALYAVVWMIVVAAYFVPWNPRPYEGGTGFNDVLARPVAAALHFLAYLGNPFCHGLRAEREFVLSRVVGAGLLLMFLVSLRKKQLPWVSLGVVVLLCAAATTLGRLNHEHVQSRYVPFAALFAVATIFMYYGGSSGESPHQKPLWPIAVLLTLNLLGVSQCREWWEAKSQWIKFNRHLMVNYPRLTPQEMAVWNQVIVPRLESREQTIGQYLVLKNQGWAGLERP
jgi:hypothetical protein